SDLHARSKLHHSFRPDDRLRIRFGIVYPDVVHDGVAVHTLVALGNADIFTMRISRRAKPGLVIKAGRFDDQRVVSFPMSDGVTVPRRIGILGKRAAVDPDRTPLVFALEELNDPRRTLDKFERRGKKHNARKAGRIALQYRVIAARHGSRPISGALGIEPRLRR